MIMDYNWNWANWLTFECYVIPAFFLLQKFFFFMFNYHWGDWKGNNKNALFYLRLLIIPSMMTKNQSLGSIWFKASFSAELFDNLFNS